MDFEKGTTQYGYAVKGREGRQYRRDSEMGGATITVMVCGALIQNLISVQNYTFINHIPMLK